MHLQNIKIIGVTRIHRSAGFSSITMEVSLLLMVDIDGNSISKRSLEASDLVEGVEGVEEVGLSRIIGLLVTPVARLIRLTGVTGLTGGPATEGKKMPGVSQLSGIATCGDLVCRKDPKGPATEGNAGASCGSF